MSAKGRIGNDGQEKVIDMEPVKKGMSNLIALKEKQKNAASAFSEAIKAIAEKSGFNAKSLRAYVNAKHAEKIDDASRDAQQLSLLFEELEETAPAGRLPSVPGPDASNAADDNDKSKRAGATTQQPAATLQ